MFAFCKRKIIDGPLLWRKLFSSAPSSNSLITVLDSWRQFWADTARHFIRALYLALCVLSGTAKGVLAPKLWVPTQDTFENNWRRNWLHVCLSHYLHCSMIVKSRSTIDLVTRPGIIILPFPCSFSERWIRLSCHTRPHGIRWWSPESVRVKQQKISL